MPVFAQNSTTIENQSITINTEIQESPETRELLQKIVEHQIEQDKQILQIQEKFNSLIDISNEKSLNNDVTKGDLVIASSAIFAFFTFGSFVISRFDDDENRGRLILLSKIVLRIILFIQIIHLITIFALVLNIMPIEAYSISIAFTILFLVLLAMAAQQIIELLNRPKKQKDRLSSSFQEVGLNIDDIIRENKRLRHEDGEY